ncbi:MAG: GNAT family N-acetyltransferase [Clostridiaceae bacterium]|nr:GNAT family N-acetyltransferase [Clostridiaceae bacterium]
MTNIYLIRHCESEGNACRRTQAHIDSLVTRKGYMQNEILRQRFQGIHIDGIYSSDSYRSIMTVTPIARERGLPVKVRLCLREISTGVWEDMAWGNIAREYPEEYILWQLEPWRHKIPGATTFQQVADLLVFGLRRIAREVGENGTALCVSHSCTIKAGLCKILNRPLSDVHKVGHGDNTSVSLIHVDKSGNFTVEYMNDNSHLPLELRRAWEGVADDDVNMSVYPINLEQEKDILLDLALANFEQNHGGNTGFNPVEYIDQVIQTLKDHPDYIAISRLKDKPTGYVYLGCIPEMPRDHGHIREMYVIPELQGKGYTEQLFGYAAHVFRYEGKKVLTMSVPSNDEEQRVVDRFVFNFMNVHRGYLSLELFPPPCEYPVLA